MYINIHLKEGLPGSMSLKAIKHDGFLFSCFCNLISSPDLKSILAPCRV